MKSKITFRKYTSKDYPQIKKNLIEAGLHYESRKQMERMVKKDSESVLIAVDGKRIIGGAYFIDMGFMAMLFRLYVIPDYKKQGIGKMLTDEVNKRAKKRKIKSVHFVVNEEYLGLKNWYEKIGANTGKIYRWMWFKL